MMMIKTRHHSNNKLSVLLNNTDETSYLPNLVSVSVRVRKLMETARLKIQLVNVDRDMAVLLAHRGYISEFIVHGIGPIPEISRLIDIQPSFKYPDSCG